MGIVSELKFKTYFNKEIEKTQSDLKEKKNVLSQKELMSNRLNFNCDLLSLVELSVVVSTSDWLQEVPVR